MYEWKRRSSWDRHGRRDRKTQTAHEQSDEKCLITRIEPWNKLLGKMRFLNYTSLCVIPRWKDKLGTPREVFKLVFDILAMSSRLPDQIIFGSVEKKVKH
jgi:hypothetical protein